MARLAISLLGSFAVTLDGEPVTTFGAGSAQGLLAYLAMHPNITHRRDALAALLWPEHANTDALRNLRVALSRLRSAIGDRDADTPLLEVTRRTIQLPDGTAYSVDVRALRDALDAVREHDHPRLDECEACSRHLQAVANLYRGEFLSGFSLASEAFETWMMTESEALHWDALEALHSLAAYYEKLGAYERVIACARRQVTLEPWREPAHRQWMRALALSGYRSEALDQFITCRRVLVAELGVEPEAATVALHQQIRDGVIAPPTITDRASPSLPLYPGLSVSSSPAPDVHPEIPEAELRIVTVLQVVMGESTRLPASVNSQKWSAMIARLLRGAEAQVEDLGGEVECYDERGLVALFGAQRTQEDDPERGVLAALAIQGAIRTHMMRWREEDPWSAAALSELDLRVIVHTGEAVVMPVESGGGRAQPVSGEAVSSAARLVRGVPPGEVSVSEVTYQLVAPLFAWRHRENSTPGEGGHFPLARRESVGKGRGIPGMWSPLVGRDHELHTLHGAVDRLHSGVGGIVTLVGEAGIGKSRLVAECRASTDPLVRWVEGRCLSYGGTMAYMLWQSVLRELLGLAVGAPPASIDQAIRGCLRSLEADRFLVAYGCLGRLLSLPLSAEAEALVGPMDAESLRHATFYALEQLFVAAAQQTPLGIVCEDLHWADPTSLALLERLLGLTDRVPLLLVCVFRPRRDHGCWGIREKALRRYPHRHVDVQLDPLSEVEGDKLLESLLDSVVGPVELDHDVGALDALKARILSRGAGNPFYVEEILRALIRRGVIVCAADSCRWEVHGDVEEIGIPETLYGVLRGRMDRLPSGALHVLQLASVIGRIFRYRLLADIAEQSGLDEHLVTLQREQMIRERVRVPEAEYIFKHQLTLDAAYGGLLRRVRRVLHRRVAEAMERLYPENVDEHRGLLAHHWEEGGDAVRAVAYLRRAGEHAAAQYANEEALGYLGRALALMSRDDLVNRATVLFLVETLHARLGAREAQRWDLLELRRTAETLADGGRESKIRLARVALREASYCAHTADHEGLAGAAQEAVRLAREAGDTGLEAAGHLHWGASYEYGRDKEQAWKHWEKALVLSRAAGQPIREARVLRRMALTPAGPTQFATYLSYHEQNLQIQREIGNRTEEGMALNALATVALLLHDHSRAKTALEEGLRLCRLTGSRPEEAYALLGLGSVWFSLGQFATSRMVLQEAINLHRQVDSAEGEGQTAQVLSQVALAQGDVDVSIAYGRRALALAIPAGYTQVRAWISLGDGFAGKARWPDAVDLYASALSLCREQKWEYWAVTALAGLARIALARGELRAARSQVQEILDYVDAYPKLHGTQDPVRVYLTCLRVLRASDDPRSEQVLQTAHKLLQQWAANIDDADLRRSLLEKVPAHRDLVREWRDQNATHVDLSG